MPEIKITLQQKRDAIKREISFRKSVYPKQIQAGKMSQSQADYQIAVFESILKDLYKIKDNGEMI